jgi:hypothetical protein
MPRGYKIVLFPHFAPLPWGAIDELDGLAAHAVILHHRLGQFTCEGQGFFAVDDNAVFRGQPFQFCFITDFIPDGAAIGDSGKHFNQITTVVRMGGGTGSNHPAKITGDDDIGICAADAGLGTFTKRIYPARSHHADAARKPHIAETALGLLGLVSFPDSFDTILASLGVEQITVFGDRQAGFLIKHDCLSLSSKWYHLSARSIRVPHV